MFWKIKYSWRWALENSDIRADEQQIGTKLWINVIYKNNEKNLFIIGSKHENKIGFAIVCEKREINKQTRSPELLSNTSKVMAIKEKIDAAKDSEYNETLLLTVDILTIINPIK